MQIYWFYFQWVFDATTSHSFRATIIQVIAESKHSQTVIAKLSGHIDVSSMHPYNFLRCQQGIKHQRGLFLADGCEQEISKMKVERNHGSRIHQSEIRMIVLVIHPCRNMAAIFWQT